MFYLMEGKSVQGILMKNLENQKISPLPKPRLVIFRFETRF